MDHRSWLFVVGMLVVLVAPVPGMADSDAEQSFVEAIRDTTLRMEDLPQDDDTRTLLERFKPRVFIDDDSYRPMNFYRDYLPETVLKGPDGRIVEENVDRKILERYHMKSGHYLDYRRTPSEALARTSEDVTPTFYGRAYSDTLTANGKELELLFLQYSQVYPFSGLPAGLSWWKEVGSWVTGDPRAWHELDIHGAIHVILHRETGQPMGVLLNQHNYSAVRLRGRDFVWPEDNRVRIGIASRSNEPYLLNREDREMRYERTVGRPGDVRALYGRTRFPRFSAGYDRIVPPEEGAVEVAMNLTLLDHDDPLNTARMNLGDMQHLFGFVPTFYRQGPPGMDYYAVPAVINLADLTAFWNIDPEDERFWNLLEDHPLSLESEPDNPLLQHQRENLYRDLTDVIEPRSNE